jgi:uncharacterized protein (DUF1800 family)
MRRSIRLRLMAIITSFATLAVACPVAAAAPRTVNAAEALHVLDRLGYGATASDLAHVEAIGIDAYIDEQLSPERIALPDELKRRLAALDTLELDAGQLRRIGDVPGLAKGEKPTEEQKKASDERVRQIAFQAQEARILRAVYSPRQLQEVMTDFWFNHFNVFVGKGDDRFWVGNYEYQAIRPYALGRFRDLLEATARHPAMQFYLDNWQNTAPDSPAAKGRDKGLNENFAREAMELHTLGVDGGYSQGDVIALARVLTGWGIVNRDQPTGAANGFVFDPKRHDFADKILLNQRIPGIGVGEGERAFDILARSPATARHICFQLAQYFVADQPDKALVDLLAKRWLETDGNIRAVLMALFSSPQFRDPATFHAKHKTPYQFAISAVRLAGTPIVNVRPILGLLNELGQPLYGCVTPDGYKNTAEPWLNPDALTRRIAFASALAAGRSNIDREQPQPAPPAAAGTSTVMAPAGRSLDDGSPLFQPQLVSAAPPAAPKPPPFKPVPLDVVALLAVVGPGFSANSLAAIRDAGPELQASMALGAPEFQHR